MNPSRENGEENPNERRSEMNSSSGEYLVISNEDILSAANDDIDLDILVAVLIWNPYLYSWVLDENVIQNFFEQFERERLSSPGNTDNNSTNEAVSAHSIALRDKRYLDLIGQKRNSTNIKKIMPAERSVHLCPLHGSEDDNNYFCFTCTETFCIFCSEIIHCPHIVDTIKNVSEKFLSVCRKNLNVAMDIFQILHKKIHTMKKEIHEMQEKERSSSDSSSKLQSLEQADQKLKDLYNELKFSTAHIFYNMTLIKKSVLSLYDVLLFKDEADFLISCVQDFIIYSLPTYIKEELTCNEKRILNNNCLSDLIGAVPLMPRPASYHSKYYAKRTLGRVNLNRPWGITSDRFGLLYVVDRSHNRVLVYKDNGVLITTFGKKGAEPGDFNNPAGIAVDQYDRVIVADKDNHRIQIFTMDGTVVGMFGTKGSKAGEFIYPWDVAVNSFGQIAVSDMGNNRVQLFSPRGVFLNSYGPLDYKVIMDIPRGICFRSNDELLTCDFNNNRIIVIDKDFIESRCLFDAEFDTEPIDRPQGIAVDDLDNMYITDSRNNRIQIRNRYGEHLKNLYYSKRRTLNAPAGITVTPTGKVAAVDLGNNRVVIW